MGFKAQGEEGKQKKQKIFLKKFVGLSTKHYLCSKKRR